MMFSYKKNLKGLYLLHPSFWQKTMFRLARLFISSKFYAKVHYVENIRKLYEHLGAANIPLPLEVIALRLLCVTLSGAFSLC